MIKIYYVKAHGNMFVSVDLIKIVELLHFEAIQWKNSRKICKYVFRKIFYFT